MNAFGTRTVADLRKDQEADSYLRYIITWINNN